MKNFLQYAKNRFLYNFLRFAIILLLGIVASNFMLIERVYALENAVDSFTYSSRNLLTYNYFYVNGGADSASISVSYYNSSDTIYNSAVFCTDINYTSVTSSTSIVKNVQLLNTDYTCKFPNSNYSGGKVIIVNYQIDGSSLSSPGTTSFFTFNQTSGGSLALIDFKISSTSYVNYKDYADTDVQIKNQQSLLNSFNEAQNKTNNKLDQAENTRKGIWETIKSIPSTIGNFFTDLGDKIGGFFTNLLNGILDGLKSLFIPGDGFFKTWFSDFKTFIEDKLGFLSTPFTIFIDFIESYSDLSSSNDIVINIPDITVPNFEDYKIISATTFNWSQTLKSKTSLLNLWNLYLDFIDVFLILNFIGLCERTYNRIFGGDTSNYEYYTTEDTYNVDVNTGEVLSSKHKEKTTHRKKVDE